MRIDYALLREVGSIDQVTLAVNNFKIAFKLWEIVYSPQVI